MKKLSLLLVWALCIWVSFAAPNFSTEVLLWLNTNGLTKFSTTVEFRGQDQITRGEAGKFVASFWVQQNLTVTYSVCDFTDLQGYDTTLLPHIKQACMFGLLKWSNGKYMPNSNLTQAEALAIVIRALEGFKDETTSPWYKAYYTRAQALWMISTESMSSVNNTNITREKLGTWFYLAAQSTMKDDMMKDDMMGKDSMMKSSWIYTDYTADGVKNALTEGKKVALFFHATWCPACVWADKDFMASTLADNSVIFKVDYDTMTDLKKTYGVTTQHTFVFLDKDMNATSKKSWLSAEEVVAMLK